MNAVKNLFDDGDLTNEEYLKIESDLAKKYCIKDKSIFRLNNLNYVQVRVNIVMENSDD